MDGLIEYLHSYNTQKIDLVLQFRTKTTRRWENTFIRWEGNREERARGSNLGNTYHDFAQEILNEFMCEK